MDNSATPPVTKDRRCERRVSIPSSKSYPNLQPFVPPVCPSGTLTAAIVGGYTCYTCPLGTVPQVDSPRGTVPAVVSCVPACPAGYWLCGGYCLDSSNAAVAAMVDWEDRPFCAAFFSSFAAAIAACPA